MAIDSIQTLFILRHALVQLGFEHFDIVEDGGVVNLRARFELGVHLVLNVDDGGVFVPFERFIGFLQQSIP